MTKALSEIYEYGRRLDTAERGDDRLGPLMRLPGTWINKRDDGRPTGVEGRGWNMIALPFVHDGPGPNYRMLVNQYNETLSFDQIDGPVPNRGIDLQVPENTDQSIFALDYTQAISQIAVDDFPQTDETIQGPVGGGIHHEPGFLMYIHDRRTDDLDIVRLSTIPHGDSVTAMGRSCSFDGPPTVPALDALPIGATQDLTSPYLTPYAKFAGPNKFLGLFDVVKPHELLQAGVNALDVKRTTELHFDTALSTGGIVNIPFVVKQANATELKATFWIMELNSHPHGAKWAMSYAQVVFLEFFPRFGNQPGLIIWPHVSINTMILDEDVPRDIYRLEGMPGV
ncbi:heme-binding protein [Antarctobacter jejuensis]|uniref:heme-binding protein n=1 Tax=Antarctobacter jejuensis TaxID=1439938 RepID=UPI003FD0D999